MECANEITDGLKKTMFEEVMYFRIEEQEFLVKQELKWNNAFVTSEALYKLVLETTESYREYVCTLDIEETKAHAYTFNAMLHIHGRALQEFLEIITLMKNGFADGAYARWRSMYELAIVSSFITENGETVLEAFINASNTDGYEWARKSGKYSKDKKYIGFNDIQTKCSLDSKIWRKQYDLANKTVHASPQRDICKTWKYGNSKYNIRWKE